MRHSERVLLVGRRTSAWGSLRRLLARGGRCVMTAADLAGTLKMLGKTHYDLVVADLAMPGVNGATLVGRIRERCAETSVVVISGGRGLAAGVGALKSGAYDLVVRPFTPRSLRVTVERALARRRRSCGSVLLYSDLGGDVEFDALVGRSAAMQGVRDLILKAALVDGALLIRGASGAGKELVARTIHRHSRRKGRPFVTVKCGSLTGEALEEALFGRESGHVPGAEAIGGCLSMAEGGSLTQTPSTFPNRLIPSGNTTETRMAIEARTSIMSSLSF